MKLGPKRRIRLAAMRLRDEIRILASTSPTAAGLAPEGYSGGYRDALDDVALLLNGVVPCRRHYWDTQHKERK